MTNQEKIEKINKWQNSFAVHPLTCRNNSNHKNLIPQEVNDNIILKCEDCDYTQEKFPEIIFKIDIDKCEENINNIINNKLGNE